MLLETQGLTKEYLQWNFFSKRAMVRVLDHVDFHMDHGSVTVLVGASGSGKSTLARCLAGLERPTGGTILYRGKDISHMTRDELRNYRRKVQIVFQGAAGTINPRFSALAAVSEPLRIAGVGNRREREQRATHWMEQVELPPVAARRLALELSGGERQRLVIARSLISNPEVIIFDESFSALDLPVATRLFGLLGRLRASYRLTYLFIGHDLTLMAPLSREVVVMCGGKIVERGATENLLSSPVHPYSQQLVRAIPRVPPGWLAPEVDRI